MAYTTSATQPTFRVLEHKPPRTLLGESFVALKPENGECKLLTPKITALPNGDYRMYFTSCSNSTPQSGSILSAYSIDGRQWQRDSGVRLAPDSSQGEIRVLSPELVPLADGQSRMYLETTQANGLSTIKSAISTNGLVWAMEDGFRVSDDQHHLGSPCCVPLDNGQLRLYYHKFEDSPANQPARRNIVSALSGNGLDFEPEAGTRIAQQFPFEDNSVYSAEVFRTMQGGWHMYYAAWSSIPMVGQIMYATSANGLQWQKTSQACLVPKQCGSIKIVSEPNLLPLDKGMILYCEAKTPDGAWDILGVNSTSLYKNGS